MSVAYSSRYQEIVDGLMRIGVPREAAEARAREIAPPPEPAEPERDARILEKAEQVEVVKNFRRAGFKVYWLSQSRASKQTPGLPDLYFVHKAKGIALWWETKRQVGGELSPAQADFRAECIACQIWHGSGDRYHAEAWLVENRLARRGALGVLEAMP